MVVALSCGCKPAHSPIAITGSTTTSALGFPTTWFEFYVGDIELFTSLSGTVSVTNSSNLFSEELFVLEFLPADACFPGKLPPSTPNSGPELATLFANFIVKTPTAGTFTLPIDFTLPTGLPIANCVALGINGGPVEASHSISASADLSLSFVKPAGSGPSQKATWIGGEMCFGQDFGCQLATSNDNLSFAAVTPINEPGRLVALYGDISDSTFDGGKPYGPPPAGTWTAGNDFFIYHGDECTMLHATPGAAGPSIAGPGLFVGPNIPADATHLLSKPLSGTGIGVVNTQVFQTFSDVTLNKGDCFVTLWSLEGGGAFDNETQVFALVAPQQ